MALTDRKLRFSADGSRLTDDEVRARWSALGLRKLKLLEAHDRITEQACTLPYPPRVFIAYKWADQEHNSWVARLADGIRQRGFEIIFDRDQRASTREPEDLVMRILESKIFVPVITDEYLRLANGEGHSSWVYDELDVALTATHNIELKILPVLRNDREHDGLWGRLQNYRFIDLQSDSQLAAVLDEYFRYTGPKLTDPERSRIRHSFLEARRLTSSNPYEAIARLYAIIQEFPFVCEAWTELVRLQVKSEHFDKALRLAQVGLTKISPFDNGTELAIYEAKLLKHLGSPREALRVAAAVLKRSSLSRWLYEAHVVIGDILDDQRNYIGALNHLRRACSIRNEPFGRNCLGVVYKHLHQWKQALAEFSAVLQNHPLHTFATRNIVETFLLAGRASECTKYCEDVFTRYPDHPCAQEIWALLEQVRQGSRPGSDLGSGNTSNELLPMVFKCSRCGSGYPQSPLACAVCGECAAFISYSDRMCPHCGNSGKIPLDPVWFENTNIRCPVCREAGLEYLSEFVA